MSALFERHCIDQLSRENDYLSRENAELRAKVTELQEIGSKHVIERQHIRRYGNRDRRQSIVLAWATRMFGQCTTQLTERALRVVEEAIEVGQAAGLTKEQVQRLIDRVYSRPAGDVREELGGLLVTCLAICEVMRISGDDLERDEMERVLSLPEEKVREKHAQKVAEGVALG